jgi:hypothetical protein
VVGAATLPLCGKASDLWGKKRMLLVLAVFLFAGTLICALTSNWALFLVGRGLMATSFCMSAVAYGVVRDLIPRRMIPVVLAIVMPESPYWVKQRLDWLGSVIIGVLIELSLLRNPSVAILMAISSSPTSTSRATSTTPRASRCSRSPGADHQLRRPDRRVRAVDALARAWVDQCLIGIAWDIGFGFYYAGGPNALIDTIPPLQADRHPARRQADYPGHPAALASSSASTSPATTLTPSWRSRRTIASPCPRAAPVTSATRRVTASSPVVLARYNIDVDNNYADLRTRIMAEAGTIVRSMIACPLPIVAAALEEALDDLL